MDLEVAVHVLFVARADALGAQPRDDRRPRDLVEAVASERGLEIAPAQVVEHQRDDPRGGDPARQRDDRSGTGDDRQAAGGEAGGDEHAPPHDVQLDGLEPAGRPAAQGIERPGASKLDRLGGGLVLHPGSLRGVSGGAGALVESRGRVEQSGSSPGS